MTMDNDGSADGVPNEQRDGIVGDVGIANESGVALPIVPIEQHLITRKIEIDAGHRVTHHSSKCRNIHGHRYTVEATVRGPLATRGSSEGMVMDFSFLKDEMLLHIDAYCDHALMLWAEDPLAWQLIGNDTELENIRTIVDTKGWASYRPSESIGNLYLLNCVPTAENLARHWFLRLQPGVLVRTGNRGSLARVRVYETPNCWSDYPESMK